MGAQLTHLAIALRRARKTAGLSQQALADRAGISRFTVAGIELGRHQSATIPTTQKLAAVLGVSVLRLIEPTAVTSSAEALELAEIAHAQLGQVIAFLGANRKSGRACADERERP